MQATLRRTRESVHPCNNAADASRRAAAPSRARASTYPDAAPGAVASAVAGGTTTVLATPAGPALADGTYVVIARQQVPGEAAASAALSVAVDTVAPARPAAPELPAEFDTGRAANDNITKVPLRSIDLAAAPYGRVFLDGRRVGGGYLPPGRFTDAGLGAPDGRHAVTETAVNAAGNESPPSAPLTVRLDTIPPAATVTAAKVVAPASTYTFTVRYVDAGSLDATTLDNGDVRVTGPFSYIQPATLVSVDPPGDGSPRVAIYQVTPPGGGWDAADNGSYLVVVQPGQVLDLAGNAAPTTSTGFAVAISPTPGRPDLQAATDSGLSTADDITNFNNASAAKAPKFTVSGTAPGVTVTL